MLFAGYCRKLIEQEHVSENHHAQHVSIIEELEKGEKEQSLHSVHVPRSRLTWHAG